MLIVEGTLPMLLPMLPPMLIVEGPMLIVEGTPPTLIVEVI